MAQNIEIKYGSFTVGTTASSLQINKFTETHSYRRYSLNVDILVTGTSDSDFVNNLTTLEDALEKDNQQLTIKFGPAGNQQDHRDFNPSNYTGLNIRSSVTKTGGELDTDRSRVYAWSLTADLPADSSDDNYRREADWSLSFDSSRRMTLSFSGTYTAGYPSSTATTATGNYLEGTNGVESWISSVFTQLNSDFSSITIQESDFELVDESLNAQDDDNHIISFSRVYRQLRFPDTAAATDNASIVGASVSFSRSNTNRHGNAQKGPVEVSVSYSCAVDAEQTTYTGLEALWTGTIKPHLLTQAQTRWSGSFAAVTSENATLDVTGNGIQASMTILVFGGSSNILREDVTYSINYDERKNFIDIWDGQPHTYSVFTPGRVITGSVNSSVDSLAGVAFRPGAPPAPDLSVGGGGWNLTSMNNSIAEENIGNDPDGASDTRKITTTNWTVNYRWVQSARFSQPPGINQGSHFGTVSGRRNQRRRGGV